MVTYHTYGRYTKKVPTKPELLDSAIAVLRRGENLTIDAVAREAGLTKPGVVHHFSTKEALTVAVVDRIIDRWESDLGKRVAADADSIEKLRAYVDYALTGTFEQSDLALLADVNLRDRLCALWAERLNPWFGSDIDTDPASRASLRAARLLADGAWFNAALGIATVRDDERSVLRVIALQLVNQGEPQ
ncbi:TetR/AcrR family transcriptional regulator [Microbacterium paraoxydans]|uniref:TetR/AcrR family transcriptional regulator n=1 Tax=Microbacterium paraoxydans TaxID=199592 RepID=UPI0035568AC2